MSEEKAKWLIINMIWVGTDYRPEKRAVNGFWERIERILGAD